MIPVAGPSITQKEIDYVTDAVTHGWYAQANDYVNRFEKAFAAFHGRRHAISLPSCTSALHLSLLALGVGAGDEVIIPDVTWIASAAPITYVGATPVFADIDSESWCLSTESVAKCITNNTKAIIAVDLYGHMPDYDFLLQLAEKHGIAVIEDAAEAFGSRYKNKLAGSFGATSCFSFHGSKTLVTGEGGMLLTDDDNIYQRCMVLRDHGRQPGDILFQNQEVAYKYKMPNLSAALGLAQLERADELIAKKRDIFQHYTQAFDGMAGISLNPSQPDVYNSYWMSTLAWDAQKEIDKFEMVSLLSKAGIASRPYFDPLTSLPAYKEIAHNKNYEELNPDSYKIAKNSINLPSALTLTADEIQLVAGSIQSILNL